MSLEKAQSIHEFGTVQETKIEKLFNFKAVESTSQANKSTRTFFAFINGALGFMFWGFFVAFGIRIGIG
jgi:hypothetical protein